jgi:hypothetical protein
VNRGEQCGRWASDTTRTKKGQAIRKKDRGSATTLLSIVTSNAAVCVFLASVFATTQVVRRKLLILLFPSTNCSRSTFADSELRVPA